MRMRGGLSEGECRQACPRQTRREPPIVYVRNRQGHVDGTHALLGPDVAVGGMHELVANALIMDGEKRGRRPSRRTA